MDKPEIQITEPVIGLRYWTVSEEGELQSPIIEGSWQPGVNQAKCIKTRVWQPWRHDGPSPVEGCSCGIYANHETMNYRPSSGVVGVVRGWGKVRVHPDGWRAEKAELLGIFKNQQDGLELIEKVAARYNVPILPTSFMKPEMLEAEFGTFVPKGLRPDPSTKSQSSYMVADYLLWAVVGSITVGIFGSGARRTWQLLKH